MERWRLSERQTDGETQQAMFSHSVLVLHAALPAYTRSRNAVEKSGHTWPSFTIRIAPSVC